MQIEVRTNGAEVIAALGDVARRQLPFATALGVTRLAESTRDAITAEMRRVFDRPTDWTLNALAIKPATKTDPASAVFTKDFPAPAARYLGPQIEGGARRLKRFEARLRTAGILPAHLWCVPGRDAPLDGYGNMPGPLLVEILSALRAHGDRSQNRTAGSAKRNARVRGGLANFFVLRQGGAAGYGLAGEPIGIAQRRGTAIALIVAFVRSPRYRMRLDFYGVARRTIDADAAHQMRAAWEYALRTARPAQAAKRAA